MKYSFLLIGEKMDSMWPLIVEQAVSSMGTFQVASEQEVIIGTSGGNYDVIIIDAGTVSNPVTLVASLRSRQPEARIVVATASPTWQRAREVLQAGAADYIRKSLDKDQLKAKIQTLLDGALEPE